MMQADYPLNITMPDSLNSEHAIQKEMPQWSNIQRSYWQRTKDIDDPLFSLPMFQDDIVAWDRWAKHFSMYKTILVLGTGGSSLGARALIQVCQAHGHVQALSHHIPDIIFMENVDPYPLVSNLSGLDWANTGVMIISKSGRTLETMVQWLWIQTYLSKNAIRFSYSDQVIVITDPDTDLGDNPLRTWANESQVTVLDHPKNLGGRFSVFSVVGILPALVGGVDVVAFRKGAADVLAALDQKDPHPAVVGAVMHGQGLREGRDQTLVMSYYDGWSSLLLWFRQLWAESLGKDQKGLTPIPVRGTVDQHSQLQLYLDGPRNKTLTMLSVDEVAMGGCAMPIDIPDSIQSDFEWVQGQTLQHILVAEQNATKTCLIEAGVPVRCIVVPRHDAYSVGAVMMHWMMETWFMSEWLGVNPVNQPAVERGKILAQHYLRNSQQDNLQMVV